MQEVKQTGRPKKFPDLDEFVKKYLPKKLPMNWHHQLMYDILMNKVVQGKDKKLYLNVLPRQRSHHVEHLKDPNKINKNILELFPRFHSKSQCNTIDYPIYEIYKNPNIRIIIVSANEDIATSFNRAIVHQLENNHKLIEDWGNLVPDFLNKKKWGEKAIIVNRDTPEKDPTVAAIGVGGKLISKRADIIIIDDLIDLETARTKQQRRKIKDWFENVLLPILEDDGRIVMAGTAWYKGDLYDDLLNDSNFDIRLKLKALMYHEKYLRQDTSTHQLRYIPYQLHEFPMALKVQDVFSEEVIKRYNLYENLKCGVLWEEKWSFEKLMEKKKNMSNSSFMRQYLNEPTTEEEKVFKDQYIKRATERGSRKSLLTSWDNSKPHPYGYGHLIVASGHDLAISKKATSDNSAIAVWGLNEKRERVLLWLDYGKWSSDELKMKVNDVYDNYRPVKIRVENVSFQDLIRQDLANDAIPVEGFHTTASKKYSEETGIAHVAMMFEQGKVIIPISNENKEYYERVKQLLYELSIYSYDQHPGDLLMATWFAFDALRDFDKKLKSNRGFFSTNALVEQMKNVRAAHRIILLGYKPPVFRFAFNSLVYIFRPVELGKPFFEEDEPFMIFATREEKSVAYIIQKKTNEIVGKIEGDVSALMFTTLLEKAGMFFNKAQIIVERTGEGEAVYMGLQERFYPNLICLQPGSDGVITVGDGFKISEANLPLSVDYFKQAVDGLHIQITDDSLIKEMGELIGVEKDKLIMSFGTGQRIKTVATALWLLDNYENSEKKQEGPKRKKQKKLNVPYRVFR